LIVFGLAVLFDPIIPRSSLIPCSDRLSLFARIPSRCAPILAHSWIQFVDIRGQFFVIRGFSSLSLLGADQLVTSIGWRFSARSCGLLFFHLRKINGHPGNIQKTVASWTQLIYLSL
jgi:hypothetical protein